MKGQALPSTVYVIDDDEAVLDSLGLFLRAAGLQTKTYADAGHFLADHHHDMRGCLVLDIRLPAISGLGLQEQLIAIGSTLPIIFITGHGDVPTAVQAMKAGAFEFIEKPFSHQLLLDHILRAFELNNRQRAAASRRVLVRERLETLTPRETEVLRHIIEGKASKVIAADLCLSPRTVEIHRANIMQKMQSKSVVQLTRMLSESKDGTLTI
jgi:FixJ family two-component response regulator